LGGTTGGCSRGLAALQAGQPRADRRKPDTAGPVVLEERRSTLSSWGQFLRATGPQTLVRARGRPRVPVHPRAEGGWGATRLAPRLGDRGKRRLLGPGPLSRLGPCLGAVRVFRSGRLISLCSLGYVPSSILHGYCYICNNGSHTQDL
jgi:hypothetical protein